MTYPTFISKSSLPIIIRQELDRWRLVAPAINNAFAVLTGKRLRETPMTPDRVKKALS
jgi:hypothetical protein